VKSDEKKVLPGHSRQAGRGAVLRGRGRAGEEIRGRGRPKHSSKGEVLAKSSSRKSRLRSSDDDFGKYFCFKIKSLKKKKGGGGGKGRKLYAILSYFLKGGTSEKAVALRERTFRTRRMGGALSGTEEKKKIKEAPCNKKRRLARG